MKRFLIITTILFTSITSIKAQDAKNDTTWEETIELINKYAGDFDNSDEDGAWNPISFKLSNNGLLKYKYIYESIWTGEKKRQLWTADLTKLSFVEKDEDSGIELILIGKYASDKNLTNGRAYNHDSVFGLFISDSEKYQRMFKAFEHLAYLAMEMRKTNAKKAGEKF